MKSAAKSILYRIIVGIGIIILVIVQNILPREGGLSFQAGDAFFVWYLLAFLSCILLSSAFIDYIRLETNWLPVIKGIAYIIVFLTIFIAFLIAISILEYIRFN